MIRRKGTVSIVSGLVFATISQLGASRARADVLESITVLNESPNTTMSVSVGFPVQRSAQIAPNKGLTFSRQGSDNMYQYWIPVTISYVVNGRTNRLGANVPAKFRWQLDNLFVYDGTCHVVRVSPGIYRIVVDY